MIGISVAMSTIMKTSHDIGHEAYQYIQMPAKISIRDRTYLTRPYRHYSIDSTEVFDYRLAFQTLIRSISRKDREEFLEASWASRGHIFPCS